MSSRAQLIRQVLTEVLAPLVAAEGGELYLTCVNEREASIHLAGRYAGSPATALLHEELALPLIESVAKGTIVTWSSGRLIPRNAERLLVPTTSPSDSVPEH